MSIKKQRAAVSTGSIVAFSKAADATWFEVVGTEGSFGLVVRQKDTDNAAQTIDRCYVEQVAA